MPPKVAAVTMTYNEPAYLPLWTRHYTRQVGADHCYIVDHGSTDTVPVQNGVNVVRIPRSAHDDLKRAHFVSTFAGALLEYYDWVLYSDVDELILADPEHFDDLPSFCAHAETDNVTAIGLDLQHVPGLEAPLDPRRPVGEQRQWVRFTSAMCKPVLTRRPLQWAPGFHCADTGFNFSRLFLFHLHWADEGIGLQRLAKTRTMPWQSEAFGAHQRVTDVSWASTFNGMAGFERRQDVSFDTDAPPMSEWLRRTCESGVGRENDRYKLDLHVNAAELWAIPPRFRARL